MGMKRVCHIILKITTLILLTLFTGFSDVHAQELTNLPEYQRSVSTITTDTSRIFTLITKASVMIKKGAFDSAHNLLEQALGLSLRTNFNDGVGQALTGLGVCDINKGNYDQALKHFNLALPYCKKAIFHKYVLAGLYNDIAITYSFQSQYLLAIRNYYNALEYINTNHINSPEVLSMIYANLGFIWMKQKQHDQALYYLKKAEQIEINNRLFDNLVKTYTIIGGLDIDNGDLVNGRAYTIKSIELSSRNYDSQSHYCALYNLAVSYEGKEPAKALIYYHDALSYISANPYYSNIDPFIGIANAYFNLNNLSEAENYLLLAIDKARKYKMIESLRSASKGVASVYAKEGNDKKAYEYLRIYSDLGDSLTNSKEILANHEFEVKYRTAEKDRDLIKNQLQITQQQNLLTKKNTWIWGVSVGAILLIISLISINSSYRRKQLVQTKEMQIIKQTQEIAELKAMVKGEEKERTRLGRELHDGIGGLFSAFTMSFNTLAKENEYLANTKSYKKAAFLLKEISSEVRKTSHNMMPEVLQHYSLPDAIRQFCDYMQDSKGSSLHIVFQSFGQFELIDNDLALSTYRIIQELIQNIVKHAHANYALVQLIMRENTLSITVEDNGIGFEMNKDNDGMGLLNLRSRIKSMNGSFSLESFKEKGTTVFIEFDLHTKGVIA